MAAASPLTVSFDVVLYKRGPYWVGHCLQLDLVTSGTDVRSVEADVVRICLAQVQYADANDLRAHLLRPPNPEIAEIIWKGLDGDSGLALHFASEVIDHKELSFRMFREAA